MQKKATEKKKPIATKNETDKMVKREIEKSEKKKLQLKWSGVKTSYYMK